MNTTPLSAREAAYHALCHYIDNHTPVAQLLAKWQTKQHPSPIDRALAQEISYGTVRRQATLQAMTRSLHPKRLKLKPKERLLLWMALYQYTFMDRIPHYAIVDETMKLARRFCHKHSCAFLYYLLQKLKNWHWEWPEDWATRFSYPPFYIEKLRIQLGDKKAQEILQLGNENPVIAVRTRQKTKAPSLQMQSETMGTLVDLTHFEHIAQSPHFYIQNFTPTDLITTLAEDTSYPQTILDLCAAPGGKLLLVHDLFPQAQLFANDISEKRMQRLQENIQKYGLQVELSCKKGEEWTGKKMDLILLDVPCSNTGVLNKRPEARWRITPKTLEELKKIQQALLTQAAQFLNPKGEIWYLTCSILQEENDEQIAYACTHLGMKLRKKKTILQSRKGWDGGFGAALTSHASLRHQLS